MLRKTAEKLDIVKYDPTIIGEKPIIERYIGIKMAFILVSISNIALKLIIIFKSLVLVRRISK